MRFLAPVLTAGFVATSVASAEIKVAVAANFTDPARELTAAFKASTGHDVLLSFGATGALYTQITQGAPFVAFLAADDKRPAQAVTDGLGVAGSVFTYAVGALALYSPSIEMTDGAAVLIAGNFEHIAVANPATASYGAAAAEVIAGLGLSETLRPKQVVGENVTQALQFIETGNAELGFVALSQVVDKPATKVWRVPADLHTPIRQDAVLLAPGENDPAAIAFLAFLKSEAARAIIERYGYDVP
jgi:molybdate transport system substrate-binding protein